MVKALQMDFAAGGTVFTDAGGAKNFVSKIEIDGRRYYDGSLRDVSKRRRLEKQVEHYAAEHERNEERFELAKSAAQEGLWDWDLKTGRMYFSPRCYEMLGRVADTLMRQVEAHDPAAAATLETFAHAAAGALAALRQTEAARAAG